MIDTQLERGDVYVAYDDISTLRGFAEGKLSLRQVAIDEKEDVWISFGDNLSVSLSPAAMRVLIAKIKEAPVCPF